MLIAHRSSLFALFVGIQACALEPSDDATQVVFESARPEGAPNSSSSQPASVQPAAAAPVRWKLTADQIRPNANLELAPNRATMASRARADEEMSQEAMDRAAKNSDADPTWRDANGKRYEALLVLEDGTVFGRKGVAPAAIAPTAENHYGGWQGVEPSDQEVQRAIDELERVERGEGTAEEVARAGTITLPQPETVILGGTLGSDRRVRQTSVAQLQGYPLRTIGALNQTTVAGETNCTGTKVGPRHVLTAAHCVLSRTGVWTGSGQFHPGQTNSTHPNAGGTAVSWSGVYARDWRGGRRWDYAVVYLEDRQSSYNLGWVGMAWWNTGASYNNKYPYIWGYPSKTSLDPLQRCNASVLSPKNCDGWMYVDANLLTSSDFVSSGAFSETLTYDIDTTESQSGSSVMYSNGSSWSTLGVHWGGTVNSKNSAARMRTSMHADICDWINNVTSIWGSNPC